MGIIWAASSRRTQSVAPGEVELLPSSTQYLERAEARDCIIGAIASRHKVGPTERKKACFAGSGEGTHPPNSHISRLLFIS